MVWVRIVGGALLILMGLLWILQGFNVIGGSSMSGHRQYAVLGAIVVILGIWFLQGAIRERYGSRVA
jgi:hypothetical protein